MINPDYEISDEDIQSVIDLLKLTRPEKANAVVAREVLERMYSQLHVLDHIDPEAVERIADSL